VRIAGAAMAASAWRLVSVIPFLLVRISELPEHPSIA
jgi:hypothetical protein